MERSVKCFALRVDCRIMPIRPTCSHIFRLTIREWVLMKEGSSVRTHFSRSGERVDVCTKVYVHYGT